MTAGPLQPGSLRTPVCILVKRPPQRRFHALKVCAAFFIVAGATKQQPEALATITRGKMISEMTAWDRNTMGGYAK